MKRVVYLLGAGAMMDFNGPSTTCLTDICSEIIKKHHYEGVLTALDSLYGKGKYNFETIIASIEYLLDWAIAYENQGYISVDNTNVIVSVFCSKFQTLNSKQLWEIYVDLINVVIYRTSEYDYEFSHQQEHDLLKKYFTKEFKNKAIKIYSLNYDRLIPHLFGKKINSGILKSSDFFNYDIRSFIKSKRSYFNLHGSIYWKMIPNYHYKVEQAFSPQYLSSAIYMKGGSPNENKIFSPIIAGYSKSQRILSEPFNFGLGAFMTDCNLCDEMVIVGYSFSDPHINSIIRNYAKIGNVEVTIVDKKEVSIIEQDLTFKFHIVTPFREDDGTFYNRDERIRIFTNGFLEYMKSQIPEEKGKYSM